ncbi:cupin domain-containing protein [Ralstonia insidiosa]|jgi:quercetin dioxygenase-like cupin family protein|uniref:Cupin n=1 Tax=Ralstonia insidiosa TaxID=190721 RepID=A0A192A6L9_9RALS|nr:cupin domain-containing protein [Ralstonia insidiosa]ANJ76039.1 cupin [Ralstonia insidiosa]KAB0469152.1 cupin domain-containing protein [Ralstonia insidiosa]MBY4909816.1 cupin domain-containing protein [Ralstonia insidiosa]
MQPIRIAAALLVLSGALASHSALAQSGGVQRADLVHQDLSANGYETLQVRVDFDEKAFAPNHAHPGEEIAHVLNGSLEYRLDGKPPVTLQAGESLFIPAGVAHSARNVGSGKASELATYVVRKGEPLVQLVR